MWESIRRIQECTTRGRDPFLGETIVHDAVLRRLETLADAAHKLSDTLKARHPDISWRLVYRFRNVAAHAYETIDPKRVWQVVESHLSSLKSAGKRRFEAEPLRACGTGDFYSKRDLALIRVLWKNLRMWAVPLGRTTV